MGPQSGEVHTDGVRSPSLAPEARAIRVAPADGVRAREGDNFPVGEAHAVKNVTQVLRSLRSIRKPVVWRETLVLAHGALRIDATRCEATVGTAHVLNCDDTGEDHQVSP